MSTSRLPTEQSDGTTREAIGDDLPQLSIVVATWNRLPELQTMLDSLFAQIESLAVEVVIVDDCSTDSTWDWLENNVARTAAVCCLRTKTNSGPGPARNLGLAVSRGRYFVPIDSDFIMMDGAIEVILNAIQTEPRYPLLFFPCLRYPARQRLDKLNGRCEISYESFISSELGEMVPVTNMAYLRGRGLHYPDLRGGGESVLWMKILADGPALFLDVPVVFYRTDVAQRICTLSYQMAHPEDLAAIADAMVGLFSGDRSSFVTSARARKNLAAGTYHLLAGNVGPGRRRLISAVAEGCWSALPTLAASLGGIRLFRALFDFYRTRLKSSYL